MLLRKPTLLLTVLFALILTGCGAFLGTVPAPVIHPDGCTGFPTIRLSEITVTTLLLNELTGDQCGQIDTFTVSYPKTSFNVETQLRSTKESAEFVVSEYPFAGIFTTIIDNPTMFTQKVIVGKYYKVRGIGTLRVIWRFDPENRTYILKMATLVPDVTSLEITPKK